MYADPERQRWSKASGSSGLAPLTFSTENRTIQSTAGLGHMQLVPEMYMMDAPQQASGGCRRSLTGRGMQPTRASAATSTRRSLCQLEDPTGPGRAGSCCHELPLFVSALSRLGGDGRAVTKAMVCVDLSNQAHGDRALGRVDDVDCGGRWGALEVIEQTVCCRQTSASSSPYLGSWEIPPNRR